MTSRVLVIVALGAIGCADFERGPAADAGPEAAVSVGDGGGTGFAGKVAPVLSANCERCHRPGGAASSSRLVLTGDATHDRLTVMALVSTTSPASSPLLVKSTGQGHGGGAVLRPDSAEYKTILDWITQGAAP